MKTVTEILRSAPQAPQNFQEFLSYFADPIGPVVNSYIPSASHPDMDRYLYDCLHAFSENAGKRHRPLICYAACLAVGGNPDKASSAAAAIEHFHTAALIHDDIADKAELRRGLPCMHITEGIGVALNAADLALCLVNGTVVEDETLTDHEKVQIIGELITMTRYTIEGQALDIGWARDGRYDISEDDYLLMATHKTAYYSGAVPLAVGALIGKGSPEQVEALRTFGLKTGLAFQIQDDLLNLIGSKEATKKDFRSDITEGKRTLVVVHALAHSTHKDELIDILSEHTADPEKLDRAVEIMQEAGSIAYARDYASQLTEDAKLCLTEHLEQSQPRDWLLSMADWFVMRLQ